MQDFLKDVKEGLSQSPKKLSSRFFYDTKGNSLFQKIMQLEEYYLPGCEIEIIENKSKQIASNISAVHARLQMIELGAGDGSKTKRLFKHFLPYFKTLDYVAMDISPHILAINKREFHREIKKVDHRCVVGNYFETYNRLPQTANGRLVLFLGSNIGNYPIPEAVDFFKFVRSNLKEKDYFLVAFDLVKNPRKILSAYDDSQGITRQFNLNLLERMNRELGANFDLQQFDHFPFYNPVTGIASSQIISLQKQCVYFRDGFSVDFDAFEAIHTEVSKKFFLNDIEKISRESKMKIAATYFDVNKEYAFVLFQLSRPF